MRAVLVGALVLAVSSGACSSSSPTSAGTTTTTPTTTTTDATITDSFSGTVPVGGTIFFGFDIAAYGNASVTYTIGGAGVSAGTQMRVSLGTIADDACVGTTTTTLATPGTTAATATLAAGIYCVSVADVGNLFAPADVTLSVLHP